MNVLINGEKGEIAGESVSVLELLSIKNVETPDMVSVQLNGKIIRRDDFGSTRVSDNDRVEFLYFMGGGSGESIDAVH